MEPITSAADLAAAIRPISIRGRGARYPISLQKRVVKFARTQAKANVSQARIAGSLGIPLLTLHRWLERIPDGGPGATEAFSLLPVVVESEGTAKQLYTMTFESDGARLTIEGDTELWFETIARLRSRA